MSTAKAITRNTLSASTLIGNSKIFWGFFLVAGVLFIIGGIAGFLAAKLLKSGAPPVPAMAIDEAIKTKQELN